MPETVSPTDITEIAEILEDRKSKTQRIAVILGSRAGALFRSGNFYDELKLYSTRNFADMDERSRFYECHAILEDICRRRSMSIKELRSFIEEQIYTHCDVENHLAELVKDDFFRVIITNNIDDVLYESFKAVGMREKVDFVDCSLGVLSCADNIELILSQRKINICRLIRMAGDVGTFIGHLNRPQAKKAAGECVRRLLEQLRIRELLVIGIDLAWDQAILAALPSSLETVWFINEDDHIKDEFIEKCGNIKKFHYIVGPRGQCQSFFKLLYWNINPSITGYNKLIEDVRNDIHNMRIDLNHIKKRSEETNADIKHIKLQQAKLESIAPLVEGIFESITHLVEKDF